MFILLYKNSEMVATKSFHYKELKEAYDKLKELVKVYKKMNYEINFLNTKIPTIFVKLNPKSVIFKIKNKNTGEVIQINEKDLISHNQIFIE